MPREQQRTKLAENMVELAQRAVFGTISETYRTCGNPGCRCHAAGPKHGPHMYVSYRGSEGKTTGYYVPEAAHDRIRDGVLAWRELQQSLRELAEDNKEQILAAARPAASKARRKKAQK